MKGVLWLSWDKWTINLSEIYDSKAHKVQSEPLEINSQVFWFLPYVFHFLILLCSQGLQAAWLGFWVTDIGVGGGPEGGNRGEIPQIGRLSLPNKPFTVPLPHFSGAPVPQHLFWPVSPVDSSSWLHSLIQAVTLVLLILLFLHFTAPASCSVFIKKHL